MRSLHRSVGESHLEVVTLLLQLCLICVWHLSCSLSYLVGCLHLGFKVAIVTAEGKVVGSLHLSVQNPRCFVNVTLAS